MGGRARKSIVGVSGKCAKFADVQRRGSLCIIGKYVLVSALLDGGGSWNVFDFIVLD